jgi:hypothetical protein
MWLLLFVTAYLYNLKEVRNHASIPNGECT